MDFGKLKCKWLEIVVEANFEPDANMTVLRTTPNFAQVVWSLSEWKLKVEWFDINLEKMKKERKKKHFKHDQMCELGEVG